jgi:hypothetical protein
MEMKREGERETSVIPLSQFIGSAHPTPSLLGFDVSSITPQAVNNENTASCGYVL